MLLQRPPLLLLWGMLASLLPWGRCDSPRHSLCYSYLKVSESSRGLPQFLSVILLDDQPIARNDNHTSRMELLVPWMGAEEATILVDLQREFRADLEWLSKLNHQTRELHTWQVILGCELGEDGSKGGFLHYGYNGMDFISFDKETLRWVAAQPQAQKVKEKWDDEPWRSKRNKVYLEEMCIERMQKYLPNQTESLKKTEPPVGKVTRKVVDDSLEVLICQAFGFYPKEIQAIWMRDGEACKYETLPRNVAPNSDGTYYVWISIEIDPKERDRFQCHLEHEGLQEPLVLAWKKERGLHSLHYFYLRLLEPSQGPPLSFIRGYLDDQPITRYDSLARRVEPMVSWMEELEKETFLPLEWVFRSEVEELSRPNHSTHGLHTWQVILGCEFREDGNKGGVFRYGYNGWDFISFNKETLRWVAAQPQAQKVKEKWDEDPEWSHENKVYLEETCILWLQRYLSYRKKALRKTEPPVGKMTRTVVDDTLETLICQAFGFYPKEIEATWMRDGENWEQETFRRTVAPNSDGTYYVWISIEIDPKERDRFQSHLEHDGLQEPLVLAWKEETATGWQIPVGIVPSLILGAGILIMICRCWRRRTILSKEVRIAPRDFPLVQIARSNISDTERIKIRQLSLRRRYKMTMKDGTPYEPLRYQLDLKDPVLTLRKRKGKGQRLKRSLTWSGDTETLHQEVSRLKQLSWPKRE